MEHIPDLDGLDPRSAATLDDFALLLRRLHARAGKPSYRDLEKWAEKRRENDRTTALLPRTTISEALSGKRLTSREFIASFVQACGVPAGDSVREWLIALGRVAENHYVLSPLREPSEDASNPNANQFKVQVPSPTSPEIPAVSDQSNLTPSAWIFEPIAFSRPTNILQHTPHDAVESSKIVPPTIGGISKSARSSWRLPVDSSQSGIAADEAFLGDLVVRAASVVGPSNRCDEPASPRQDAYKLGRDPSGAYLIVAIADGISSGARADLGAIVATASAVAFLRQAIIDKIPLHKLPVQKLFTSAAQYMMASGGERGFGPEDISATLITAVIPTAPSPDGTRTAWFGWLADPSAWQRTSDSWQRIAGDTEMDSFENRLPRVLPFHPHQANGTTLTIPKGASIAMVTDGVGDAFEDVDGANRWFAERWENPPPLASFILDVSYEARGCGDDRTAVVVWCDQQTVVAG